MYCNASSFTINTSGEHGLYNHGGTFHGGTGDHSISPDIYARSNNCYLTSGTTTLPDGVSGVALYNVSGLKHNNGTVKFTENATQEMYNSAGNLYNVVVDKGAGNTLQWSDGDGGALTIENNLTVTSGEYDTSDPSDTSYDLTVNGDVSVSGTFTGNASAISFGSLTINSGGTYSATSGTTTITGESPGGYTIDNDGTFTHNNGKVLENTNLATNLNMGGDSLYDYEIQNGDYKYLAVDVTIDNDCIVNFDDSTDTWNSGANQDVTIGGKLTITSGWFGEGSAGKEFGNVTAGSVEIQADGTWDSKDATITSVDASDYSINNNGTWNHNSGTIQISNATTSNINMGGNNLYNLKNPGTGTTTFTFNKDNIGFNTLTIDQNTEAIIATNVDAYADTLTNNGTLTENGILHTDGSQPWEFTPIDIFNEIGITPIDREHVIDNDL